MTPDIFVKELLDTAPSIDELVGVGLSVTEASDFRKSYAFVKRNEPWAAEVGNELIELLSRWDASSVQIGMVSFAAVPITIPSGIQVGFVECDPLVMTGDNEVVVFDEEMPTHLMWRVAATPATCLDSLVYAARFLAQRSVLKIDFEDFTAARFAASRCATIAGGHGYEDFFRMLLGSDP